VTAATERRLPLTLTADEQQLQKVIRDFVTDVVPQPSGSATAWAALDPDGRIWRRMSGELGLQGLAVAEELGGQGFGVAQLAIAFHELGRVICAAPLLSTAALAGRLLANLPASEARDSILRGIVDGSLRVAVVPDSDFQTAGSALTGAAAAVIDASTADLLLVITDDAVHSVEISASGVTVTPQEGMDLTRDLAGVRLDGAAATTLAAAAGPAINRATAEATVLLSAELVGVAEAALGEAVEYAKIRTQFGRQIGSFQSLKHRMADMLVATEGAWSTCRHAALLCDATDPVAAPAELRLAVSVAKAAASTAATFATAENVHIHGGIGFTWEHSAHLRFRRARSAAILLGSPAEHRSGIAAVLTGRATDGPP
jgi:alkylation response protein AidB-like acyl-CoA dehydrogenase